MEKLFKWMIFWLFFVGLHCYRLRPAMHPESMDVELELQWENLEHGQAITEIEMDGDLNPSFLLDRNGSLIFVFNSTCNDEMVKDAQQSGRSHAASDDFAQMKIFDVPQDPHHSNGSAYHECGSGRDGVGIFADSRFMASELFPNGTLLNYGRKLFFINFHVSDVEIQEEDGKRHIDFEILWENKAVTETRHTESRAPKEKQDISDIAEERNPKGSIVVETKRSSKRSLETKAHLTRIYQPSLVFPMLSSKLRAALTETAERTPAKILIEILRDLRNLFQDVGLITGDMHINVDTSCLIVASEILKCFIMVVYHQMNVTIDGFIHQLAIMFLLVLLLLMVLIVLEPTNFTCKVLILVLTNYEVISNEANLPLNDIQAFTHGMCYTHQIVASAVSLPEPVFVAHELVKHGRNN